MARWSLAVGTAIAAVAVLATAMGCGPPRPGGHAAGRTDGSASGPATSSGPDGRRARWVMAENDKRGTTAWRIRGKRMGAIHGYANRVYAEQGQRVTLYVTTAAPRFHVDAYRMGYYHGAGARRVWRSRELRGKAQPRCQKAATTRMVNCVSWSPSVTLRVTRAFVQGDYLLKLTDSRNQQSYVPLTIWDPSSRAAYVVKNDVFTWQAWNPYGGYDLYTGKDACPSNVYPLCSRARVVSYDRPYGYRQGAGDFLGNELPLVRFAEQHGLDVTYATDLTVQQHPHYLDHHRALLSLGHDECWSLGERRAVLRAHDRGMNIAFFAASPVLRHVRTQPSRLGEARQMVDYRDSRQDPLNGKGNPRQVTGNTWASAPANWPEDAFVGDSYAGFLEPGKHAGFDVSDGSAWIFRHTGLHTGSVVPRVIASDVDHVQPGAKRPRDLQIFGHSRVPAGSGQTSMGAFYSDMTYYTDRRGGAAVFDSGTNNWIPALARSRGWAPIDAGCSRPSVRCPWATVRRITGNLLRAFGAGPAGRSHPSRANAKQVLDRSG